MSKCYWADSPDTAQHWDIIMNLLLSTFFLLSIWWEDEVMKICLCDLSLFLFAYIYYSYDGRMRWQRYTFLTFHADAGRTPHVLSFLCQDMTNTLDVVMVMHLLCFDCWSFKYLYFFIRISVGSATCAELSSSEEKMGGSGSLLRFVCVLCEDSFSPLSKNHGQHVISLGS